MAIDIARFYDPQAFKTRLQALAATIRSLPRGTPDVPVMIPGDPEKLRQQERLVTGIPVDPPLYEALLGIDGGFAEALVGWTA
jgi:LDH2 family malate/lactate/ureidoglycolate dehydrogenase